MTTGNGSSPPTWPYHFEVVPLKHMTVDIYQRPLTSFVDKIEAHFKPALLGTLCVSERSKTKYAVIDGQTRAEGMRRVGFSDAPCVVYTGLTLPQEADLFAELQTERRGMTSTARFNAQVIAGHERQVAVNALVQEHGFEIGSRGTNPATIQAVSALEYVYQGTFGRRGRKDHSDPELLGDVLDIIREAWPKLPDTAKSAVMIRGLGWYLARDTNGNGPRQTEVDLDRLINRLSKVTPSELAKRAEALREGRGMSGNSPAYMAEAIEAQYRKRG